MNKIQFCNSPVLSGLHSYPPGTWLTLSPVVWSLITARLAHQRGEQQRRQNSARLKAGPGTEFATVQWTCAGQLTVRSLLQGNSVSSLYSKQTDVVLSSCPVVFLWVVVLYIEHCDPGHSVDLITESECTEIRSVTESESRHILFTLRSADMIGNVFLRLSSSLIHLTELSETGRGEGGEREERGRREGASLFVSGYNSAARGQSVGVQELPGRK